MTYEQIVNLWKAGYSKMYMYELEYLELKKNSVMKNKSKLKLQKQARLNVDSTIKSEYTKFYGL